MTVNKPALPLFAVCNFNTLSIRPSASLNFCFLSVIIFLLLTTGRFYSQGIDIDSIKTGKSYKFTLINDKSASGKLLSSDSVYIRIFSDKNIYKIRKEDVISVSIYSDKVNYKCIIGFTGGLALAPANYDNSDVNKKTLYGFNMGFETYLIIPNEKSIRFSLSYTRFKKPGYSPEEIILIYPPPPYKKSDESAIDITTFKIEYPFGDIYPFGDQLFAVTIGVGYCFFRETAYSDYYIQNDTILNASHFNSKFLGGIVFSGGFSLGYKVGKKLGVQARVEYNVILNESITNRVRRGFVPFTLGVYYAL